MNIFAVNLLLAAAWAAFAGSFSAVNLGLGFFLGFIALWTVRPLFAEPGYFLRVPRMIRLAGIFLVEFVVSSVRVARDVLSPVPGNRPGIIAVPLEVEGETGILLTSSLVTLTPGTLSLDLSDDSRTLFVHAMFVDDPDALRAEIRNKMERPVMETLE